MENQIIYTTKKEFTSITFDTTDNYFLFSGADCRCLADYLDQVYAKLSFPPIDVQRTIDTYFDWIRDLNWLSEDEIVFVITDFDLFLSNDKSNKELVIKLFENEILPWWEMEVINHVVGGTPRKFTVYLVSQ